jgi:hypothetical protein
MLALVLVLWCAGTGCMIVSYARGTISDGEISRRVLGQAIVAASGAMDAHACCKARHKSLKQNGSSALRLRKSYVEDTQVALPANSAPSGAMSCCPLTSGSIVVASRTQTSDSSSTLAVGCSSYLELRKSATAPLAVPLRLPNRAQSYLLDCAFLI